MQSRTTYPLSRPLPILESWIAKGPYYADAKRIIIKKYLLNSSPPRQKATAHLKLWEHFRRMAVQRNCFRRSSLELMSSPGLMRHWTCSGNLSPTHPSLSDVCVKRVRWQQWRTIGSNVQSRGNWNGRGRLNIRQGRWRLESRRWSPILRMRSSAS